jgi:hypothetical protein
LKQNRCIVNCSSQWRRPCERRSGGDWGIVHARKDQEARDGTVSEASHRTALTLGAISMGVKQYKGWIAEKVGQRQIRVVGHRAGPEAAAG